MEEEVEEVGEEEEVKGVRWPDNGEDVGKVKSSEAPLILILQIV